MVHSNLKIDVLNRFPLLKDFQLEWLFAWLAFDTLLTHFRWADGSEEPAWVRRQLFQFPQHLQWSFDSKCPQASKAGSAKVLLDGSLE